MKKETNIGKKLESILPKKSLSLIKLIDEISRSEGCGVYLVGGIVRDMLLDVRNLDLDFAVEGDAIKLARAVVNKCGGTYVTYNRFKTATVVLPDSFRVDFATARKERYEKPAALPTVEPSSIRDDLYRRDFTINAMAASIADEDFGRLVDFFGGEKDLAGKKIKVLHDKSFIDDPTRILRAIRLEQRFGFKIESHTEELLKEALRKNLLKSVGKWRLNKELALILKEKDPKRIFKRMERLGIDKEFL